MFRSHLPLQLLEKFNSAFRELLIQALKTIKVIYLKGSGVTHAILPDGFGCFEEIFFKQIYFGPENISHVDVVIDLGAHQGTFTIYSIINMKPRSMLISIEPNPKAYHVLLENIRLYKHVIVEKGIKIYAINKAVYTSKSLVRLKITRWSETPYISDFGELNIQTITVGEIFSLFRNLKDPIILLKMDIEGTEHKLLADDLSLKFLKICRYIAIEPHKNPNKIRKALEYLGFKTSVHSITLEPMLYKKWLNYKPRLYTSIIAFYRLITSSVAKPKIIIVKAER